MSHAPKQPDVDVDPPPHGGDHRGVARAGDLLFGKYRLVAELGRGGVGVVFSAWHELLERWVAIKVMWPETAARPDMVARFLREARVAANLESDHVVRVLDVYLLADGAPVLVMEHLEGRDLSFVRGGGEPLPVADAVRHVREACAAVALAHERGVVHRDLKPGNLFLARGADGTERIKVLDFGASKLVGAPGMVDAPETPGFMVIGSLEYMSPEQLLCAPDVDERADVWGLGVALYELCTATVPFPGRSVTSVCARVVGKPAPPPRVARPDLSAELEAVILRCLEKSPAARFPSVAALEAALAAAAPRGA
jgi:serine/threonine-protein kinase